jgi:hypothetical protein
LLFHENVIEFLWKRDILADINRNAYNKEKIMSKIVKAGLLFLLLAFTLAGCELFDMIALEWTIGIYSLVGSNARVYYTVTNSGFHNLTGINVEIQVANATGIKYSGRTSSFSLNMGESTTGAYLDIYTNSSAPVSAAVISVDMDDPQK